MMLSLGELPTSGGVSREGSSHVRLGSVHLRGHRPVGLAQSSPTLGSCHALGEGCQLCPLPPVGWEGVTHLDPIRRARWLVLGTRVEFPGTSREKDLEDGKKPVE